MEIKEIKGYLGTGCKLIYACILDAENDEVNILDSRTLQHAVDTSYGTYEVRLALRPLSDLTKEIEHNGEKFVPLDELKKYSPCPSFWGWGFNIETDSLNVIGLKTPGSWLPLNNWYVFLDKLYEWHFDIHNLIEKGEAININTLK